MSNTRYDIVTPRPRKDSDKPYWHKVGTAFADDRGGFTGYLDSLPLPDSEGRTVIKLFEAKSRDEQHRASLNRGQQGGGSNRDDLDDSDIPF